jgi:hypothetical protein
MQFYAKGKFPSHVARNDAMRQMLLRTLNNPPVPVGRRDHKHSTGSTQTTTNTLHI